LALTVRAELITLGAPPGDSVMPASDDNAHEFMKEFEKTTETIGSENDKQIDVLQDILDPAEKMKGENQKVIMEKLKPLDQQIKLINEQTVQMNKVVQAAAKALK